MQDTDDLDAVVHLLQEARAQWKDLPALLAELNTLLTHWHALAQQSQQEQAALLRDFLADLQMGRKLQEGHDIGWQVFLVCAGMGMGGLLTPIILAGLRYWLGA